MKKSAVLSSALLALLAGCSSLLDPNQTTRVVAYPAPSIASLHPEDGSVRVKISSQIDSPDFLQYVIYVSSSSNDLAARSGKDPNAEDGVVWDRLSQHPYFATNVAVVRNPDGSQVAEATLAGLANGRVVFVAVSAWGSNRLAGDLRTNKGWLEGPLCPPRPVSARPQTSFTLSNWAASTTGDSLDLSGGSISAGAHPASLAAAVQLLVYSLIARDGQIVPCLLTGTGGATIRPLGALADSSIQVGPAGSGVTVDHVGVAVTTGWSFFLSTPTAMVKISVTNATGGSSAVDSPGTISGSIAWQTNLSAPGL